MQHIITGLAFAKTFSAFVLVAAPNFLTGNALLDRCATNDTGTVLCIGYVEGVADLSGLLDAANGSPQCIPTSVMSAQVRDVVIDYLKHHPATRHEPAANLVLQAIHEAWKCGNTSSR